MALLNPKRADNTYPFTELSGCGLAFKLLQGLAQQLGHPLSQLFAHLELLVLSIAQDRVSILGENRILCYHGLRQLNTSPSASPISCVAARCAWGMWIWPASTTS